MKPNQIAITTAIIAAAIILTAVLSTTSLTASAHGAQAPLGKQQVAQAPSAREQIARGKYLVDIMGCHDCHTPMKMGPQGPERDWDRALSGHPEYVVMPPAPSLPPGPWISTVGATFTAWNGPWGTSFTMNLTPDKETGLGDWTVEEFIATMKTGRERGKGRPVLPPMPVEVVSKLTDTDIRALFAYLQSVKPIKNRIPQPIEPPDSK